MDDFAHNETERILAELERKIKELYADDSTIEQKCRAIHYYTLYSA